LTAGAARRNIDTAGLLISGKGKHMNKRKPRTGSIYARGGTYWIKYYRRGQSFRESSHSDSYEEAERLLKRRQGEVVTGKFAGLTVERIRMAELFNDVVEDYSLNGRRSIAQLESRLKNHLRPSFGEIRAAEFSTGNIKRYIAKRRHEQASNATINRELEIPLFVVAYHVGNRLGELKKLRWEQVDSERYPGREVSGMPLRVPSRRSAHCGLQESVGFSLQTRPGPRPPLP
jgi:hypothetical protein